MRSSDGVRALCFVGVVTLGYVAVFVAYPIWNALAGGTEVTLHVAPISFESSDPSASPIAAMLLASLWVFAVFLVLSCHRLVFALAAPVLLGVSTPPLFYLATLGVPPNIDVIGAVFETDSFEFQEMVTIELVIGCLLAITVGVALAVWRWRMFRGPWAPRIVIAVAFLAGLPSSDFAARSVHRERFKWHPYTDFRSFLPFDLVEATVEHLYRRRRIEALWQRKREVADLGVSYQRSTEDDLTVVVVVGESARADRLHLNGYEKQTTPRLERIEGLVNFADVEACGTLTRISVPCMLTRATAEDPRAAQWETSLVSLFREAGFDTMWLSLSKVYGEFETATSAIASEAEHRIFRPEATLPGFLRDELLIEPFARVLKERPGDRLIVLHTIGSHWRYANRSSLVPFQPICDEARPNRCTQVALDNTYDNSIRSLDSFLADLIALLEDDNALLIYASDHGELLGEYGRYGHGHPGRLPELVKVPLLVWPSPAFARSHGERVAALGANRSRTLRHSHLFHTILDCAGISSPAVDPSLSLCRRWDPPATETAGLAP